MRSKKTLINTIVSGIYQVVALICGLITPKLMLEAFGSTYNGAFESAAQFLSLVSFLAIGVPGAARLELYKMIPKNDYVGISKVVAATQKVFKKISVIIVLYAVVLSIIFPYISNSDLSKRENVIVIAIVCAGLFAENLLGQTYYIVIDADQKQYIRRALNIGAVIINTIAVCLLISKGVGIFTVKIASSVVLLLVPLVVHYYVIKLYGVDRRIKADTSVIPERKNVLFHSVANYVHDNTDVFVITLFLDIKMVSVYAIYHSIIFKLRSLSEVFTNGLESAFGILWVSNDQKRIAQLFSAYETFVFSFISVVFSCAIVLIMPFISLYTSNVVDINYYLVDFAMLMIFTEILYCLLNPYKTIIQATGSYEDTRKYVLMEAVLNLSFSLALVIVFRLNGVLIATSISMIYVVCAFVNYVYSKIIKKSIIMFVKRIILLVLAVALITFLSRIIDFIVVDSWFDWFIKAFITFGIASVVSVVVDLIFYREDILVIGNRIKLVLKK